MQAKRDGPPERRLIREAYMIIGVAFILSVGLLLYSICLFLGWCYLKDDSTFSEIGICLTDEMYQPVRDVSAEIEALYLCGQIEGTTPRRAGFYLFFQNTVTYTADFEHAPGLFFQSLPIPRMRQPGTYRIEMWYARRLLATTEFSVNLP